MREIFNDILKALSYSKPSKCTHEEAINEVELWERQNPGVRSERQLCLAAVIYFN